MGQRKWLICRILPRVQPLARDTLEEDRSRTLHESIRGMRLRVVRRARALGNVRDMELRHMVENRREGERMREF